MKNKLRKLVMVALLGTVMTVATFASTTEAPEGDGTTIITEGDGSGEGTTTPEPSHVCEDNKVDSGVLAPTCTASSSIKVVCGICGAELGTKSQDKLGHDFNGKVTVVKEAKCFEDGKKTVQCTRCTETKEEVIPKTSAHQMSGWKTYSTATKCTEKDKEINKCLTAGCTQQEIRETSTKGPCEEKSERKDVKAATCKEEGYTGDVICKHCGRTLTKGSTVAKTGHVASSTLKNKKASTCKEQGYSGDLVCKHCDTVMEAGIKLALLEHVKGDEIKNEKKPTCKENGYTGDKVCKNCDKILEYGEAIVKLEHVNDTELKNRKEATCSVAGYSGDVVCKNCGEITQKGSITMTAAHTPKVINQKNATCKDEGYTGDEVCEKCAFKISMGKSIPKTTMHTFGEWTVIQEATETAKGTETRECTLCHNVESRNIPKIGGSQESTEVDNEEETDTTDEEVITDEEQDTTEEIPEEDYGTIEDEPEKKDNSLVIKVLIVVGIVALAGGLGTAIYFKKFKI